MHFVIDRPEGNCSTQSGAGGGFRVCAAADWRKSVYGRSCVCLLPALPCFQFASCNAVMLTRTGHARTRTRTKPTRTRIRTRTTCKDKDLTHKDKDLNLVLKDKDFTYSYLLQVAAKPTIAIKQQQ